MKITLVYLYRDIVSSKVKNSESSEKLPQKSAVRENLRATSNNIATMFFHQFLMIIDRSFSCSDRQN